MEELILPTLFINKRMTPVDVFEYGRPFLMLPPGKEFTVESYDPETSFARFKEITFLEGDRVDCRVNKEWTVPESWKDKYLLELVNRDGSPMEGIYLYPMASQVTPCYKGIPRLVAIIIQSPLIRYKKIEWKFVKERKKNPANPDYLVWTTVLKMVKEERSKDELDRIEQEIKARAKQRRG
jgi:hypothetical protein